MAALSRPGFACLALTALVAATAAPAPQNRARKPTLSVKASPTTSFSPSRIFLVAELKGGADDYEDYYCPTVEWDWDDGTESVSTPDCAPYEAGKSQIKRRYATEHVYRHPGEYRIRIRLKRGDRVVAAASATVRVQPGVRGAGQQRPLARWRDQTGCALPSVAAVHREVLTCARRPA